MNIKKIKELIDLMNDNGLTEVEIEQEGLKLKLTKRAAGIVEQVVVAAPQPGVAAAPAAGEAAKTAAQGSLKEVKAPMVGTFYKTPGPDAEAYVKVGSVINKGDVLCIVEAMKLMNEVKAEFSGKIVEICVDNAEAVEFGQVLFLVEPK